MKLDAAAKKKLLARLARAEGQVAAVRRMVDEDRYCVDVLVQLSAARGALAGVGEQVLRRHIETCVAAAMARPDEAERQAKIDELMDVFARFSGIGKGTRR